MNKKLLIIGGNGYIGTHLLDYLKINGLSSINNMLIFR
jgi:nucleoside-diphosphate-sugar epimerase